jgi:hypothetical protein
MSMDELVNLCLKLFFSNNIKDADAGRRECRKISDVGWKAMPNMDSESRW